MRSESQSALLDLHGRVQTFAPFKVVLVGDYMLDRQIRGTVDRISPEAPVPVLTSRSQADFVSSPGGSGNVAACLAALSGVVHCIGVVGDDPDGGLLRTGLESIGCVTEGLVEDSTRPTTLKQSMVGLAQHRHPQKMFRFDIESTDPLSAECEQRLLDALAKALPGSAVVCLE
ncbi:MAG: PfkB family carbohydrate kinase, partial [Planctomycetota bacterium]|nr:PfkB family carbohydrate kinase [Planctomycetota bacterium]